MHLRQTFLLLIVVACGNLNVARSQATGSKNLEQMPSVDPIFIQEVKLQKVLQSKDYDGFKALLLPDFLIVSDKLQSADQFIAARVNCTIGASSLQNHQIRRPSREVTVITYRLNSITACGEQKMSDALNETTIWVRRDGKWLAQLHTETVISKPTH